jgi:signal peptidase I
MPVIAIVLVSVLGAVLLLVLVGYSLRTTLVIVTVNGASMQPTLRNGDRVIIRRTSVRHVRPGQIIMFRLPDSARPKAGTHPDLPPPEPLRSGRRLDDRFLLKRAVAVPGDPVPDGIHPALRHQAGTPVPPGRLVALGDNAAASFDSRNFGFVTPDLVMGVVVGPLRIRPASPLTSADHGTGDLRGHRVVDYLFGGLGTTGST